MSELRIPPDVIERVLNHKMPGMRRRYDHSEYRDRKRAALEKWEAHLLSIVRGTDEKTRAQVFARVRETQQAKIIPLSDEREAVLAVLKNAGTAMRPMEIAAATGRPPGHNLGQLLLRMTKRGEIINPRHGRYMHPDAQLTDQHLSDERKSVLAALHEAGAPMRPVDIAAVTGMSVDSTCGLLARMATRGEVIRIGPGQFVHPNTQVTEAQREKIRLSDKRRSVLALLNAAGADMRAMDIAAATQMSNDKAGQLLWEMRKRGEVIKTGHGRYAAPHTKEVTP
jgi:hypothetical protein